MPYSKTINKYTKIIIQGSKLITREMDAKEFQIEVSYDKTSDIRVKLPYEKVPAIRKNDFEYQGASDTTFENDFLIGTIYYFRSRVIKSNGKYSDWTDLVQETAGDTTNLMTFTKPVDGQSNDISVVNTSTAVTFTVLANNVPSDFDVCQWKFLDVPALLTDDPITDKPAEPTTPSIDVVPDYESSNLDDISTSFSKDKITWRHAWIRSLDTSGNIGTDGWFYIGCGKLLAFDPNIDWDNTPPNYTSTISPSYIENIL